MAARGILLFVVALIYTSHARKCWFCQNARSNTECLQKGRLQQCLINQEYCQNEVRAIGGGIYFEVTKRCKQDNSCSNNRMQNFTGTVPFQCATEEPHSVCRCCCGFDNCNGPNIVCMDKPPSCEYPDSPINGYVTCPSFLPIGTTCAYRCRAGYQLEGADRTECEMLKNGELAWTNGPPECVVKPCVPLTGPDDGDMTCTDEWNIGSECSFVCDPGRVLIGKETIKCSIFSTWDDKVPRCEVVECLPPRPLDPHFVPSEGVCTDRYNYESVCSYECHPDYDLVGIESIECGDPIGVNNRGTWSDRPPRCQPKICLPPYPECTGNEVNDTCQFSCERCERMNGDSDIECTRDGWSGPRPTCVTITCGIEPAAPANGDISCDSPFNQCDDSCRFTCDTGYRLVGASQTTCLPSGGWSNPTPICELAECELINLPGIRENCPDGLAVGATCTLTCEGEGMEFIGEPQVRCKKDPIDPFPIWDPVLNQYCRYILCPNFPAPRESPRPDAGTLTCGPRRLQVTNDADGRSGWRVESQCEIQCNEDFQAKDLVEETDCTADGQWTVSTLCCVECVTNTALDVVVLLDRTEGALWDDRLTFMANFLDFTVIQYGFNINVTFIPFGDDVSYANAIDFMTIDDDENWIEDLEFLTKQFAGIPSFAGQDSNSGKAMKEVVDNIFGFHNYRVPMIFLVTTRAPSDLGLARQVVQQIQDKKIHLRIMPITGVLSAEPGANRAVFESMVEDRDFVVDGSEDEDRAEDFHIMAGDRLISVTRRMCNERAQGLQPCLFA